MPGSSGPPPGLSTRDGPERLDPDAERRDEAKPGDDDSAFGTRPWGYSSHSTGPPSSNSKDFRIVSWTVNSEREEPVRFDLE